MYAPMIVSYDSSPVMINNLPFHVTGLTPYSFQSGAPAGNDTTATSYILT